METGQFTHFDTCKRLSKMGYKIAYIPEYEIFFHVMEEKPYDPSNNRHHCILIGNDITDRIENYSNPESKKDLIDTSLSNINKIEYKFSYNVRYVLI